MLTVVERARARAEMQIADLRLPNAAIFDFDKLSVLWDRRIGIQLKRCDARQPVRTLCRGSGSVNKSLQPTPGRRFGLGGTVHMFLAQRALAFCVSPPSRP